jgi:hypothetical protein
MKTLRKVTSKLIPWLFFLPWLFPGMPWSWHGGPWW